MDKTIKDLFVQEIKDLYHAEKQVIKALPQMVKKANSDDLKDAIGFFAIPTMKCTKCVLLKMEE